MAPKRKSDTFESLASSDSEANGLTTLERAFKKPRASDATDVSSGASSSKEDVSSTPRSWKDVKLEGEDEVCSLPLSYELTAELRPSLFTYQAGVPV